MKIFHVITSLKMGGAEAALFNYLFYTKKHYDTQHLVAYIHAGPYVQKIRDLGVPVYCVRGWLFKHDLGKLVKSFKPDVLHTSLWSANVLGRLLVKRFSLPLISELHGDCRYVSQPWKNWVDARTVCGVKKQKIIAVSDGVREAYQEIVIGAIKDPAMRDHVSKQLMVIKNGIDLTGLRQRALEDPLLRSELGLYDSDFLIGSVGRLEAIKSYDILLRAFKEVRDPGMKLCLVGDGSERHNLEKLADALQIREAVIFVGQRTDAYRFYPLFDCFALSSQTEGLSLALLEALAFGLPVITTNKSIKHEVLIDKVNGLLVPVNNVSAYAAGIKKLYGSPDLRRAMHQENLVLIELFGLGSVVARYQNLYECVVCDH